MNNLIWVLCSDLVVFFLHFSFFCKEPGVFILYHCMVNYNCLFPVSLSHTLHPIAFIFGFPISHKTVLLNVKVETQRTHKGCKDTLMSPDLGCLWTVPSFLMQFSAASTVWLFGFTMIKITLHFLFTLPYNFAISRRSLASSSSHITLLTKVSPLLINIEPLMSCVKNTTMFCIGLESGKNRTQRRPGR